MCYLATTMNLDPTPVTRHLRAMYGSRVLIAAVCHLRVFDLLAEQPLSLAECGRQLGLAPRPAMVLFPTLLGMGLLEWQPDGRLGVSDTGRYLTSGAVPSLIGYVGLEQEDAGVLEMVARLKNDGPADTSDGLSYVKEGDDPSPMDDPEESRRFTLALAGRARLLAPLVAKHLPTGPKHLLDVAGGTGYYTFEWLLRNPEGTATLFDRPQVLEVAKELMEDFCRGKQVQSFGDRITFCPGDMLEDALPQADLLLAGSLFHDWPDDTCAYLMDRFAGALRTGGELWIHDTFLNDDFVGPVPATDYSAALFWATKGRIYSRAEHEAWMRASDLTPSANRPATGLEYGLVSGRKQF